METRKRELIYDPDYNRLIASYPGTPNARLLAERQEALNMVTTPKVGDYIKTTKGELLRFTIDHGDSLQAYYGGSFYLGMGGCDFSGACGDSIPVYRMIDTGETRLGPVWFFNNDEYKGGNGYNTEATFKIWEEVDDDHLNDAQWKQRTSAASRKMISSHKTFGYDSILFSAVYLPKWKYPEHHE